MLLVLATCFGSPSDPSNEASTIFQFNEAFKKILSIRFMTSLSVSLLEPVSHQAWAIAFFDRWLFVTPRQDDMDRVEAAASASQRDASCRVTLASSAPEAQKPPPLWSSLEELSGGTLEPASRIWTRDDGGEGGDPQRILSEGIALVDPQSRSHITAVLCDSGVDDNTHNEYKICVLSDMEGTWDQCSEDTTSCLSRCGSTPAKTQILFQYRPIGLSGAVFASDFRKLFLWNWRGSTIYNHSLSRVMASLLSHERFTTKVPDVYKWRLQPVVELGSRGIGIQMLPLEVLLPFRSILRSDGTLSGKFESHQTADRCDSATVYYLRFELRPEKDIALSRCEAMHLNLCHPCLPPCGPFFTSGLEETTVDNQGTRDRQSLPDKESRGSPPLNPTPLLDAASSALELPSDDIGRVTPPVTPIEPDEERCSRIVFTQDTIFSVPSTPHCSNEENHHSFDKPPYLLVHLMEYQISWNAGVNLACIPGNRMSHPPQFNEEASVTQTKEIKRFFARRAPSRGI
eukprot:GHVH01006568.1.p1 GENE.GHVH01006568.1~~GHVH01006568.1.p1  ORF type:complete len:515 (+),score=73.53 GHVH01006568.1:2134-3678(+)